MAYPTFQQLELLKLTVPQRYELIVTVGFVIMLHITCYRYYGLYLFYFNNPNPTTKALQLCGDVFVSLLSFGDCFFICQTFWTGQEIFWRGEKHFG